MREKTDEHPVMAPDVPLLFINQVRCPEDRLPHQIGFGGDVLCILLRLLISEGKVINILNKRVTMSALTPILE